MVIVDTSVWVAYLRTLAGSESQGLDGLLERGDVLMTGFVMAELLQGVRSAQQMRALASRLSRLPYEDLDQDGWISVGALAFQLRMQGQTLGLADLAIAVLALEGGHKVYTLDTDFQRVPGLQLYEAGAV